MLPIRPLPTDDRGWLAPETAAGLSRLISEFNVKTAVEVGSWLGQSSRHIAAALPPEGVLYCVDHWRAAPGTTSEPPGHVAIPSAYHQFLANVANAELSNRIVPVRMESLEAAAALEVELDLAYIDADHNALPVFVDVMAWYHKLSEGGVICGDDWSFTTVKQGVSIAANLLKKSVSVEGVFWWFER